MTNHRKAGKMFMRCFALMLTSIIIAVLIIVYGNERTYVEIGPVNAVLGVSSLIFGFYGGFLLSKEDV